MSIHLSGLQSGNTARTAQVAPMKTITVNSAPTSPETPQPASAQVNISLAGQAMTQTRIFGAGDTGNPDVTASMRSGELTYAQLAQLIKQGWDGSLSAREFTRRQEAIARGEDPDGGRFGKFQNRLNPYMVTFFSVNDKKIIGEAYELVDFDNEYEVARVDKLVMELGTLRIWQHMTGELIRSADPDAEKVNPDEVPYEPDSAHLPLLGEIKRMSARSG
jgi:hypothetical protein